MRLGVPVRGMGTISSVGSRAVAARCFSPRRAGPVSHAHALPTERELCAHARYRTVRDTLIRDRVRPMSVANRHVAARSIAGVATWSVHRAARTTHVRRRVPESSRVTRLERRLSTAATRGRVFRFYSNRFGRARSEGVFE